MNCRRHAVDAVLPPVLEGRAATRALRPTREGMSRATGRSDLSDCKANRTLCAFDWTRRLARRSEFCHDG